MSSIFNSPSQFRHQVIFPKYVKIPWLKRRSSTTTESKEENCVIFRLRDYKDILISSTESDKIVKNKRWKRKSMSAHVYT